MVDKDFYIDNYEKILKALTLSMNKIHNVNKKEEFWEIIFYRDLGSIIRLYQFSELDNEKGNRNFEQKKNGKSILVSLNNFFKILKKILLSYTGKSTIILFPDHDRAFLNKTLAGKNIYSLAYNYNYDRLFKNNKKNKRREDLYRLLCNHLPENLSRHIAWAIDDKILFNFKSIYKRVELHFRLIKNIKCSIGGFYPAVEQRVLLAIIKERSSGDGIKVITNQHGGNYGEIKFHQILYSELKFSNIFTTWGWCNEGQHIKLPATRLIDIRKKYNNGSVRATKDKLLFVLKANYSEEHENRIQIHRVDLLNKLNRQILDSTIIRLRRNRGFGNDVSFIEKFNGIEIDYQEQKIFHQYKRAKLVVLESLFTTSFLECLTLDIPVIILLSDPVKFDNIRYPELIKGLIGNNIVFTDPDKVSAIINSNFDTIRDWWNEQERKAAVNAYKEMHAYIGDDPEKEWTEFFDKVI